MAINLFCKMTQKNKAQAGLEYLMTYGWALILIATVVGVLVFVVSGPSGVSFSSSDSTKMVLKSAVVNGQTAGIVVQNTTGGKIKINSISFSGDIGDSAFGYTLNGQALQPTDYPIEIITGGEISLENLAAQRNGENGSIFIDYTDYAGFGRQEEIKSGSGGPPGLVGAYWFDEVSTATPDASGNKNTGTISGALQAVEYKSSSFSPNINT